MSLRRILFHSISVANRQLGGAFSSRAMRSRVGRDFAVFCLSKKFAISNIGKIQKNWVIDWTRELETRGLSAGTVSNKISAVRSLARSAGADLNKLEIARNRDLSMAQRSRAGTKLPATDAILFNAVSAATEIGELGFCHIIKLERYLGIRGLESVMSTDLLKRYAREAKSLMSGTPDYLKVMDGTKGGRTRITAVIKRHATATYGVILDALEFAMKNGGFLLVGPKGSGLKGARAKYHRVARKVGLVGPYAPHCFRYRYAVDKLIELTEQGIPSREALSMTAGFLGHGPSRGRWVRLVYGSTVTDQLPKSTRIEDIERALSELGASPEAFLQLEERLRREDQ